MWCKCLVVLLFLGLCNGQRVRQTSSATKPTVQVKTFNERVELFSIELLYHTSQATKSNLVVSPITVWTSMAVLMEGAAGKTAAELRDALRIGQHMDRVRSNFRNVAQQLVVNTSTITLENLNTVFTDITHQIEEPFKDTLKNFYFTRAVSVNFREAAKTAALINNFVNQATHGRIPTLVQANDLSETQMILTNAVYFKGQWATPFNRSLTVKAPFFDAKNRKIGDVNMMYNRGVYPYANLRELQARVVELPYGKEHRLSMLVLLPHDGVSVNDMYKNFITFPLHSVFESMVVAATEYEDDEVDCFIPRFKITSDIILNKPLQDMGINDVFEPTAQLPNLSKTPVYLSRVIHKAEIEVTEEGTVASAVNAAELSNRNSVSKFEANHPFAYVIIEKTTNTVVFAGVYEKPELF